MKDINGNSVFCARRMIEYYNGRPLWTGALRDTCHGARRRLVVRRTLSNGGKTRSDEVRHEKQDLHFGRPQQVALDSEDAADF